MKEINTRHGAVQTPAYLPCATHGTVKSVAPHELKTLGLELILSNIYHLYLRPGIDLIEKVGGIHKFMGWDGAIFTDSGGFQAFSLGEDRGNKLAKTSDEGITFYSHIDGGKHFFTPEKVIEFQERIGVDIATCLDVCTGFPETEAKVRWAVERTNAWAERSIRARTKKDYLLYGMVQGSIYPKLRRLSAEFLCQLPFDGYAIGGNMYTFGQPIEVLNKEKPKMWEMLDLINKILPANKLRHLLGVGEPADIIEGVKHGIDTFDCVMATRMARNGAIWMWVKPGSKKMNSGLRTKVILAGKEKYYDRWNLAGNQFSGDCAPLSENCNCVGCKSKLPRAWFYHGFKIGEPLAQRLATIHNLNFLQEIVVKLRGNEVTR